MWVSGLMSEMCGGSGGGGGMCMHEHRHRLVGTSHKFWNAVNWKFIKQWLSVTTRTFFNKSNYDFL
jgi:hypothetical protein